MRLIDADALIPTQVHTVVVLKDGREQLESVLYAEQVDDAPTVEPASPWHRVEEPPKQNGAFAVACVYDGKLYWYKGIYIDGKWLREDGIEMPADYWMPLPEPPKEDA